MAKKTLILIGAGPGLGNAVAREFAAHDFRVALVARRSDRLHEYENEMKAEGIEVMTCVGDAAKPETLTAAIDEVRKSWGTPDALVYNVGNTSLDGDREITSELLMERYQVDAASAYHCANIVATDEFAEKKGTIIFTGGGFAKTFQPIMVLIPLCINKAALNAMNIIMHHKLEPKGIFVGSVIVNGVIDPENETHSPEFIAKKYWQMYTERTEFEMVV